MECEACGSGYLDPRPTRETVYLAYRDYYTHGTKSDQVSAEKILGRSWVNRFVTKIISSKRAERERKHRHLPIASHRARLLDVGSGDGGFLVYAQSVGYEVFGCDIDARAVDVANTRGLQVRQGGIEAFDDLSEYFDVITLGHCIEHVYDPREVIRRIHSLLKPGGIVWIETPNFRSYGYERFGENWRGLEPPRHLTLFHWESLESVLKEIGFVNLELHPFFQNYRKLAKQSCAIQQGKDPNAWERMPDISSWLLLSTWLRVRFHPDKTEFITLTAKKAPDRSS